MATRFELVLHGDNAVALRAADRACVLEVGRVVLAGEPSVLQEHDSIRRSYLGY